MRHTLTEHHVNECNRAIAIDPDDLDPNTGASHLYEVTWMENDGGRRTKRVVLIPFQRGPINEVGMNGLTLEVLLAIAADKLRCSQASRYACEENAEALAHIQASQAALLRRTKARAARGVEGTHEV